MKKYLLVLIFTITGLFSFSQVVNVIPDIYVYKKLISTFNASLPINSTIYILDTKQFYTLTKPSAPNYTLLQFVNTGFLTPDGGGAMPLYNVGIGSDMLNSVTTGFNNIAIGNSILSGITTGGGNIGIGGHNMPLLTTASGNIGLGWNNLSKQTSGNSNIAIGVGTMPSLTTGQTNVGVGAAALELLTTGIQNVAIGTSALQKSKTGTSNTVIGTLVMGYDTTGDKNVAIGEGAGLYILNGERNVLLGHSAFRNNKTASGSIALGYEAGYYGNLSNTLVINNSRGGKDTAIVYGVMNGTSATNTLQLNAGVQLPLADTIVTDPVGMIRFKNSDKHLYLKVAATGNSAARWKQIDN